jgi:hypothetical protein
MSRSIRRLAAGTLSLLAVLAGTAVVAAPAQAAGITGRVLVQSVTASSNTPAKTQKVTCPTGKVIISGGAYVDGPHTIRVDLLRPDPYGKYFEAGAHTTWGRPTWRLYVFGVCANPPAGLTYVTALPSAGNATSKYAFASCPAGKRAIGGGARAAQESGRNVVLDWVHPDGTLLGWAAHTMSAQGGEPDPWTTEAYAVCADPVGAQLEAAYTNPASPPATSVIVSCDSQQLLAAGGSVYYQSQATLGQAGLTGVYSNDLTWSVVFAGEDGTGNPETWTAHAYAICL